MSQPDLIAHLREARPVAPAELRERVRLIAVEATVPPRRRITWRRAAVLVLVVVAAAGIASLALLPRSKEQATGQAIQTVEKSFTPNPLHPVHTDPDALAASTGAGARRAAAPVAGFTDYGRPPAASASRIQRYTASLGLELKTPGNVSDATRRAVAIATSLSGYQQSVTLRTASKAGYAHIVLRIPVGNVREAIRRLSALGTIIGENVAIQDLQAQVNATDKRIARLQLQLAALVAQFQTTEIQRRTEAVSAQIERLQRARASTVRAAHYATVDLQFATPQAAAPQKHEVGPLHGLGIAFHWAWIGAVYALALGTPLAALGAAILLLARAVRRRREDALLAR